MTYVLVRFCGCGLAMYAIGTQESYVFACAECDPHLMELVTTEEESS